MTRVACVVFLVLSGLALPARAQNVEILDQRLDADRQGTP